MAGVRTLFSKCQIFDAEIGWPTAKSNPRATISGANLVFGGKIVRPTSRRLS
jgi:hypothetical protein